MMTPFKQAYANAITYIMPMPLLATLLLVDDALQNQLPAPPLPTLSSLVKPNHYQNPMGKRINGGRVLAEFT